MQPRTAAHASVITTTPPPLITTTSPPPPPAASGRCTPSSTATGETGEEEMGEGEGVKSELEQGVRVVFVEGWAVGDGRVREREMVGGGGGMHGVLKEEVCGGGVVEEDVLRATGLRALSRAERRAQGQVSNAAAVASNVQHAGMWVCLRSNLRRHVQVYANSMCLGMSIIIYIHTPLLPQ
jgi:hypothetical protein